MAIWKRLAFGAGGERVAGKIDVAKVGGHFQGELFHFIDFAAEALAPGFAALGFVLNGEADGFERAGFEVHGDCVPLDTERLGLAVERDRETLVDGLFGGELAKEAEPAAFGIGIAEDIGGLKGDRVRAVS